MRALSKAVNAQEIVKYEHDLLNKIIRVYIGQGDGTSGEFVFEPSYGMDIKLIEGPEYDALVKTASAGEIKVMNTDKLWAAVDAMEAAAEVEIPIGLNEEVVKNAKLAK